MDKLKTCRIEAVENGFVILSWVQRPESIGRGGPKDRGYIRRQVIAATAEDVLNALPKILEEMS